MAEDYQKKKKAFKIDAAFRAMVFLNQDLILYDERKKKKNKKNTFEFETLL